MVQHRRAVVPALDLAQENKGLIGIRVITESSGSEYGTLHEVFIHVSSLGYLR